MYENSNIELDTNRETQKHWKESVLMVSNCDDNYLKNKMR